MHAFEGQRLAKLSADFYSEAMVLRPQIICWKTRGHYIRAGHLCQTARNLLALCDMSGGELDYALLNSQVEIHCHDLAFTDPFQTFSWRVYSIRQWVIP
jgi:hypothetical protein